MFRCPITKQVVPPRTPMKKVVLQTRGVIYTNPNPLDPDEPIISKGWEIVKEIGVSPEGYKLLQEEAEKRGLQL